MPEGRGSETKVTLTCIVLNGQFAGLSLVMGMSKRRAQRTRSLPMYGTFSAEMLSA